MKKLMIMGGLLVALALGACGQVKPGYAGVKVSQFGSGAGVDPVALGTGTYFLFFGQNIEEFPVYSKVYNFTQSHKEGNPTDEAFKFHDNQGVNISADVGVQFSADPVHVPSLYTKFRSDYEGLLAGPVRNEIRSALLNRARNYSVDQIYGPKQQELIDGVQADVQAYFKPYGLNIEKLFLTSNLDLPDAITSQITHRVAKEQEALAENAQVVVEQARAKSKVALAQGDHDAQALRNATLTPEGLKLRAIEAWEKGGSQVPRYVGSGASPIPFIDGNK